MHGSELKALRKQAGLTQSQVAELIGLTKTFVGLMERGASSIERRTEMIVDERLRARIDVSYCERLSAWTVSILVPTPRGRRQEVLKAHTNEGAAAAHARELAKAIPGSQTFYHDPV